MPRFTVDTSVVVPTSPATLFDFVTTPTNWSSYHPGSKKITGTEAVPAKVGIKFVESIGHPNGNKFDAQWEVTRADQSTGDFEFQFVDGFSYEEVQQIVITYYIKPAEGGTHWRRTMVVTLAEGTDLEKWGAFQNASRHQAYQDKVKAKFEEDV